MLTVMGSVGLARFAFGMILPSMAGDLGMDYSAQGFLGASYFVGYLLVVAAMPWLAPRVGSRLLCAGGLAVVGLGLLAMAFLRDYLLLSASYFVTGLGSGAGFVGAMALASHWFEPSHRARGAGLATAGAGAGILFSGLVVPHVEAGLGLASWQLLWFGFAALNALFALLAAWLLRDRPAEMGLAPYGRPRARAASQGSAVGRVWLVIAHLGVIYALFAVTMLTFTTFAVTTMIDTLKVAPETAGLLWAGVGGLSMVSGPLFGNLSDRFGHRWGMASALLAQAVAYGLLASGTGVAGLYAAIALFGLSAWSMPSIVAAAAGDYLGPEKAAAGFAVLTLMFAAGQVLGPAGAGILADWTGTFALSYAIAAGINCVAVVLCFFLSPAHRD